MNDQSFFQYISDTSDKPSTVSDSLIPLLDTNTFAWIHFRILDDSNLNSTIGQIEQFVDNDEIALEDLLSDNSIPTYKNYESGHLLIIRCINPDKTDNYDEMVPLHIWIKSHLIITLSHSDIYAIDSLKADITQLNIDSRSEFLIELFSRILNRITDVMNTMDESIDTIESELLDSKIPVSVKHILDMQRKLLTLRRFLNPQKDLLQRMLKGTDVHYSTTQSYVFRDISEQNHKTIDDIDHLRERLSLLSESLNNLRSQKINQTMYTLSIVASLFLPLSFLTGLMGANVGGIPGVNSNYGFLALLILCTSIFILEIIFLRKQKIL